MTSDLLRLLIGGSLFVAAFAGSVRATGRWRAWAHSAFTWMGLLGIANLLVQVAGVVVNREWPGDSLLHVSGDLLLLSTTIGGLFAVGSLAAEGAGQRLGLTQWAREAGLLVGSIAGALMGGMLYAALDGWLNHEAPFWSGNRISGATMVILLWIVGIGATVAALVRLLYNVRLQTLEADRARLSAESTSARLAQLEARLRPHFLYNALSGLAELIHEAPDRAEAMTLALARLLQRSLDGSDAPTLPLRDELALVRAYLDVEQPRFGDRLQVTFNVEDAALDALVPRLTLQPLVENAIKHGLGKTGQAVHIYVTAQHGGPRLQLAVADDGPAFPADLTGGHGLTSVTERLALLYDDRFTLQFTNATPGTMKHVRIALPFTPAVPALAR